ncbi:MAG: DUF6364 family protein [Candidatus Saccharimonadales bacterium]
MEQTPITLKIDSTVKKDAQKLAKSLGLSLSAIVENKLREVIRERRVVFEEPLDMSPKATRRFRKLEEDVKAGRNISGSFNSFEELEERLNSLGHAD